MAPTSITSAGKLTERLARAMWTAPNSRGWRSVSSARRLNSGISSRNRTPRCARLSSPGRGWLPPPMSAISRARVMRCAERARVHQPATEVETAGDGVDGRHRQRFIQRERRQKSRHPPRQHRLARAGRTAEEQVMRPGRGDLEGASARHLAMHVGQVIGRRAGHRGHRCRCGRRRRIGRRQDLRGLEQGPHRKQAQRLDHRGFSQIGRGEDHRTGCAPRGHRHRQEATDRRHTAVERQPADDDEPRVLAVGQRARRGEDAQRDREVERRADLAHISRSQADRDALAGIRKA